MNYPLINRHALKAAMKSKGATYEETASLLGITASCLTHKLSGRKGRGLTPFTEEETQMLRSYFGDGILYPAPVTEKPRAKQWRGYHE